MPGLIPLLIAVSVVGVAGVVFESIAERLAQRRFPAPGSLVDVG